MPPSRPGGRPRGTLYAVYTFLEDVVSVRGWTASEGFIPTKPMLEVRELNVVGVPKPGTCFRVAPPGNADAVEAVYTDRIVCAKQR